LFEDSKFDGLVESQKAPSPLTGEGRGEGELDRPTADYIDRAESASTTLDHFSSLQTLVTYTALICLNDLKAK
jgi:hypothetical protein